MDVSCANCREPWDTYHLMWDEVHECVLDEELIKMWEGNFNKSSNIENQKTIFEKAFEERGWKFAHHNVCAILRCPACEDNEEHNGKDPKAEQRAELTTTLAEMLDGDEDGFASMSEAIEDFIE